MISTGSIQADALLSEGIHASQSQDNGRALHLFEQASIAAPCSGIPHFLIASEYASMGNMDSAEAAFAQAVLCSPELTVARYQLGLLQFSSGRAALALVTWQALLELPDTSPFPHFVKGFTALARDDFGMALAHYHAGLERNLHNPPMSADIRKIIDGIHALDSHGTEPGTQSIDSTSGQNFDQPSGSDAVHVLFSNYRQTDSLH